MSAMIRLKFRLAPADNEVLNRLCGPVEANLRELEKNLGIEIENAGDRFLLKGAAHQVHLAESLLQELYRGVIEGSMSDDELQRSLRETRLQRKDPEADGQGAHSVSTPLFKVACRGPRQMQYVEQMRGSDLCFGVGPAGTGKTYLAVACAVESLRQGHVERLVLVRPAVEAGEKLGFLPGDLSQKVDPYLRPIYDALFDFLGHDGFSRELSRNRIEIAPLAFMRGRSLNYARIILDEAQNTTSEQMKMFLTRIGAGSSAVITGDLTQIDLRPARLSGLRHALKVLQGVEGVSVTHFSGKDVVRHPLVQRIISAYDRDEGRQAKDSPEPRLEAEPSSAADSAAFSQPGLQVDLPAASEGDEDGSGGSEPGLRVDLPAVSNGEEAGSGAGRAQGEVDLPAASEGGEDSSGGSEPGLQVDLPAVSNGEEAETPVHGDKTLSRTQVRGDEVEAQVVEASPAPDIHGKEVAV